MLMLRSTHSATVWTSALALGCLAGLAHAGPLDQSIVPAGAPWVIHVDVEAAVASKVGSFVLQNKEAFDLEGLDSLKVFGIDLSRDLLSVTLFAPGDDESEFDDGVVAALTTPAIDGLWNHLKTEPHAKSMTIEGVEMLSWDDHGERKYGIVTPSADAKTRLALISAEWENLVAAVKGRGGQPPRSIANPGKGSIIFFETRRLPDDMIEEGDDNTRAIFSRMNSAWVDLGEADARVHFRGQVDFKDPKAAGEMRDVLQGLVSFVRIVAPGNEDVAPIARMFDAGSGPTIGVEGTQMRFEISAPSESISAGLLAMKQQERDDDEDADEQDDAHGAEGHDGDHQQAAPR